MYSSEKSQFNTELARESVRVVHEFETLKQTIDSYNKLSRLNIELSVEHCTVDDNPFDVALKAREYFYPGVIKEDRAFLKALIGKCAEQNIFSSSMWKLGTRRRKPIWTGSS